MPHRAAVDQNLRVDKGTSPSDFRGGTFGGLSVIFEKGFHA